MAAEASHAKRDYSREADRLEEEDDEQHHHASVPCMLDCWGNEDDAESQEGQENQSWLYKAHQSHPNKTADSKCTLSSCKKLRSKGIVGVGARFHDIIDKHTDFKLASRVHHPRQGKMYLATAT